MLIDSHAHLNFEDFKDDYNQVISDCQREDVWMINVGSQLATSRKAVEIAEQYETGVYAAVGLHPIHVSGGNFHPEAFNVDEYRALLNNSKKIVAIGETGLDFFHSADNSENQQKAFAKHLNLAKEFDLPIILHSRNSKDKTLDAYEEILKLLKEGDIKKGVIHCFGGTLDQALAFIKLGFYVGFTGIITFDKIGQLEEVVKNLPLEKILIETDSPFLAPDPNRGKRNLPLYVKFVAEKIAKIKQILYNEVEDQTTKNAINLFNLK